MYERYVWPNNHANNPCVIHSRTEWQNYSLSQLLSKPINSNQIWNTTCFSETDFTCRLIKYVIKYFTYLQNNAEVFLEWHKQVWYNQENVKHAIVPMKNAPNARYSSHPCGKSPNIVTGRRYINNIDIRTKSKPKKWVQMFPVSVWILWKSFRLKWAKIDYPVSINSSVFFCHFNRQYIWLLLESRQENGIRTEENG